MCNGLAIEKPILCSYHLHNLHRYRLLQWTIHGSLRLTIDHSRLWFADSRSVSPRLCILDVTTHMLRTLTRLHLSLNLQLVSHN